MFQTASKYNVDVTQTGRVEFSAPFAAGAHLTVFVISEQPTENVDDSKQKTTEALVAELYAADNITFKQAQHLLNHPDWQDTVAVLEQHGCQLYYDKDDFEEDLEISSKLSGCLDEISKQPNDHSCTEVTSHLVMTREKLNSAVVASERILKEAAQGKLPRYV
jgi:predicted HTH domain antitoxin